MGGGGERLSGCLLLDTDRQCSQSWLVCLYTGRKGITSTYSLWDVQFYELYCYDIVVQAIMRRYYMHVCSIKYSLFRKCLALWDVQLEVDGRGPGIYWNYTGPPQRTRARVRTRVAAKNTYNLAHMRAFCQKYADYAAIADAHSCTCIHWGKCVQRTTCNWWMQLRPKIYRAYNMCTRIRRAAHVWQAMVCMATCTFIHDHFNPHFLPSFTVLLISSNHRLLSLLSLP